jgi:hypothetical protein
MVFQRLLFKPNPLEPNSSLNTADSPVPDPLPVRKLRRLIKPDSEPAAPDVVGEASPCIAVGTAVTSCDSVVCVPAPLACATVAACAAVPVVVAGASVNGVNADAAAEDPA